MITVCKALEITAEDEPQLIQLAAQVTQRPVRIEAFRAAIWKPSNGFFVARDGDQIVGMGSIHAFRSITKYKAKIENVVVGVGSRGNGVGRGIVTAMLDWARAEGVEEVELTSNPKREAAHELYKGAGFKERSTTVFTLVL